MSLQDYVIRLQSGLWEIWLDDQLIGGHPTQMSALQVAQALAHAAANRGQRSRILVGDLDGRISGDRTPETAVSRQLARTFHLREREGTDPTR